MKRMISFILTLLLLTNIFSTALADPLDENGETGGSAPGGNGSYIELWDGTWIGMRITVIDISDSNNEIDGVQQGIIASGTVSVDITNLTPSDNFFVRKLAGDNKTPLANGDKVIHFGNTSKMAYRDGVPIALSTGTYHYQTVQGLPKLMGENAASVQTIMDFINNQPMLTQIAEWCGGGLTYETLTGGKYKLLTEPIMYCLIEDNKFAFTPTEAALLKPHGESTGYTLINNTLANAFFLKEADLGWDAWTGATDIKQPWDTIKNYLGMHIYSITPKNSIPDPTPDPTPTPNSPPPQPELPEGKLTIIKVEDGTNIRLDGAVFEITRTSHWEAQLIDPNGDDTGEFYDDDNGDELNSDDSGYHHNVEDLADDVWEWIEVHETEYVGTYSTTDGKIDLDLDPGSFIVKEITPPTGYILDEDTVQIIDIPHEAGSNTPTLTFENKKQPGLIIKKYDEDTGLPLASAEFSVAHKGGSIVYEGITPDSGAIILTDLPEGWYTVTELSAPSGYLKRDESKDIFLPAGETVEIKFDNRRRPALEIIKLDSQTKKPLAGATFRIWNTEGSTVGEYVTDADGKILIPDLEEAIYSVEEIEAPEGYLLDPQHKDIKLTWGKVQTLIFTNTKKSGLSITKYDESTGEHLAGAEFSVAQKGGTVIYEGKTDENGQIHLTGLSDGWYTITEIKAPDGYLIANASRDVYLESDSVLNVRFANQRCPALEIIKIDAKTKQPLAGATFRVWETESQTFSEYTTDSNGRIFIPNLEEKIYSVEEITAPEGYILETQHKDIRLEWGQTKTLTFTNLKKPTLTIRKYDELTNEPIAGASFRLWLTEGETWSETLTTDENGVIVWKNLDPGIYSIQEIDEPFGYFKDPSRKEVLLEGSDDKQLAFFNRPRPVLTIFKCDLITGEPLEGVKFLIQRVEGDTIGEFLTDKNGKIELSPATGYLLTEDVYRITEIEPSERYLLSNESVKEVQLKWQQPTEVRFENLLKPTFIFAKTNGLTGRGIDNATYKIEYEDTNGSILSLGTFKSKCGLIVLPYVLPGWYILTETVPASGYSLPTNPVKRIHLTPGENSYTYEQTPVALYVDPRTNPNSGDIGACKDWCGYLCSVLCAGTCNVGKGNNDSLFGNITITNGNGDPLGTASESVSSKPSPTPKPDPEPESEPTSETESTPESESTPEPESTPTMPPVHSGGIIFLNPDFSDIHITFGN